jgi:hypothetical protein
VSHTGFNPIIDVRGDDATLGLQFIVYSVLGDEKPASGWPAGTKGAQGRIAPIESGYWQAQLTRSGGAWKIVRLAISHDLPYAF